MNDLTDEVRASLIEAGIGKHFHDRSLADVPMGADMLEFLKVRGQGFKRGYSVGFYGVGGTDAVIMLARALHINGIGCKVLPLVRMRRYVMDAEFRDTVDEADVLVLLNAQDTRRGNPLHDNIMAEVEWMVRRRADANKSMILQFAIPEDKPLADLDNCYWTDEMIALFDTRFDHIRLSKLAPTRASK